MTPKEKAQDILDMFGFIHSYDGLDIMDDELTNEDRKQCALIVVNEIMDVLEKYDEYQGTYEWGACYFIYWDKVKQEIENI